MARDATARQYDVDADAVRLDLSKGEITFRARKGRLVDLDKLHESIWATRLSGNTGMGLNWIDVTAVGEVADEKGRLVLKVKGSEQVFVLKDPLRLSPHVAIGLSLPGMAIAQFFDGERTPNLPHAAATFSGLRHDTAPGQILMATYEGVVASLLEALQRLKSYFARTLPAGVVPQIIFHGAEPLLARFKGGSPVCDRAHFPNAPQAGDDEEHIFKNHPAHVLERSKRARGQNAVDRIGPPNSPNEMVERDNDGSENKHAPVAIKRENDERTEDMEMRFDSSSR